MAALPLSAGTHDIEFRYYNKDLTIGIIISIFSLVVFVVLILLDLYKKRKHRQCALVE